MIQSYYAPHLQLLREIPYTSESNLKQELEQELKSIVDATEILQRVQDGGYNWKQQ